MRRKIWAFIFIFSIFSFYKLITPASSYAALQCNIAFFDPATRTLSVCVGDFDSEDEFHSVEFYAQCTSSGIGEIPLIGSTINCNQAGMGGNLSSIAAAQTGNKYYGCFGLTDINVNVRSLGLTLYSGDTHICTVTGDTSQNASNELLFNVFNPQGQGNMPIGPTFLCNRGNGTGIDTAFGCIPIAQPESIISFFIRWSVRIGGGIAMLVFLAAGFQFITSSGNPEKIQSAKDLFIAGVSGLLMIIFSVFLLRLIGFNILGIFT